MTYERLADVVKWLGNNDRTYESTANVMRSTYGFPRGNISRRPIGINRRALQSAINFLESLPKRDKELEPDPRLLINFGKRNLRAM